MADLISVDEKASELSFNRIHYRSRYYYQSKVE